MHTELENLELELENTDDFNEVPPSDVIAFNELRSCADLLRMYQENQLDIEPDFQREVVWSATMQTRLIDSLVKQLPIPSLCISLDYKTQERFVIDGLQRIASIVKFLNIEKEWKLSKLDDVDNRISGNTNKKIHEKHNDIFSKVQNTVIPITVLRCDYSKKSHMDYLFTIFHRLNTGGSKLTNQEIRNCIFNGEFNSFLKSAAHSEPYLDLFGIDTDKRDRFSNEELVLRFLAFTYNRPKYNGKLAHFLNVFMDEHQNANNTQIEEFNNLFHKVISLIHQGILQGQTFPKLSKATTEALFVGVAENIELLQKSSDQDLSEKFQALRSDDLFSIESLKEGLAQKQKVINRLNRSIEIFAR